MLLWVSFSLSLLEINPSVSWWEFLWVHLPFGILVLLRLGCIFPSPDYRWFQPLFLQIGFLSLYYLISFVSYIMWMLVILMLFQRSLKLTSFFKNPYVFSFSFFYLFISVISTILSSRLLIHSPRPSNPLSVVDYPNVFFISIGIFFRYDWVLFYISFLFCGSHLILYFLSWVC